MPRGVCRRFANVIRLCCAGQQMPAAYKQVLDTLAKTGDFKDNVLKVNIPRTTCPSPSRTSRRRRRSALVVGSR